MPDKPIAFLILKILSENQDKSLSLEEVAKFIKLQKGDHPVNEDIAHERELQSAILDHLILLNDQGLLFLDPETDKSSITAEGQQKIKSKYTHKS